MQHKFPINFFKRLPRLGRLKLKGKHNLTVYKEERVLRPPTL